MRSEHNRGASLAAFLLAVSTVTLLFVSPVEGQGTTCTTNADCPPSLPYCNIPQGATEGECSSNCVVTAFPGEPGSCPATDDQGNPLLCSLVLSSGQCQTCESNAISGLFDCETVFSGDADQIANCQRDCFDSYPCTSNADCPADQPTCFRDEADGYCVTECNITALPGAAGSCPGIPEGYFFFGPQYCARPPDGERYPETLCVRCAGRNTPADCESLERDQEADVVANCKRSCFDFYACATNADCTTTEPFCNVPDGETEGVCGECVVGAFPGENGSCAAIPEGQDGAGRQICGRNVEDFSSTFCVPCAAADEEFQFEFGTSATAADCQILVTEFNQNADAVANCQRECFAVYSCATNADCPSDRPICNAGQCEISIFSPLDGMGGGSSA